VRFILYLPFNNAIAAVCPLKNMTARVCFGTIGASVNHVTALRRHQPFILNSTASAPAWTETYCACQRRRHIAEGNNIPISITTVVEKKCLLRVLLGAVQIAAQLKIGHGELHFTSKTLHFSGCIWSLYWPPDLDRPK